MSPCHKIQGSSVPKTYITVAAAQLVGRALKADRSLGIHFHLHFPVNLNRTLVISARFLFPPCPDTCGFAVTRVKLTNICCRSLGMEMCAQGLVEKASDPLVSPSSCFCDIVNRKKDTVDI